MDATAAVDPSRPPPTGRRRLAILATLLALVFCAWLPSLSHGFVTWDDPDYVWRNPAVTDPDLAHILSPRTLTLADWTPVGTLVYAATNAAAGGAPWAFHLVNVLAHLAAMLLVVRILEIAGFSFRQSVAAAALFGLHPLQVESVTWISSLKNVLAAGFGFGFLLAYLRGRLVASTALLVLALGSKGTAIAFPVIAAAATLLHIGRRSPSLRTWLWFALWTALAVARAAITLDAQDSAVRSTEALGLAGRLAAMGGVLLVQMRQFVAPYDLSILYEWPPRSFGEPRVLAAWAGVASLVTVTVLAARRDRALAFAAILVAASLAPTLNVVPAPYLQADRYVHVALAGLAALVVAATRPLARIRPWLPAAVLCGWAAGVLVPSMLARQDVWRSGEALYGDASRKTPTSGVAWGNLGSDLLGQGRSAEARVALERSRTLRHPEPHIVLTNLAHLHHDEGDMRRAEEFAREALRGAPEYARALAILGRICAATGRQDEAGRHLDDAIRLDPTEAPTFIFRAEWNTRANRLDAARADVARAWALPRGRLAAASVAAAIAFLSGNAAEAMEELSAAAPPDATDEEIRGALAQNLAYLGHRHAAQEALRMGSPPR